MRADKAGGLERSPEAVSASGLNVREFILIPQSRLPPLVPPILLLQLVANQPVGTSYGAAWARGPDKGTPDRTKLLGRGRGPTPT